MSMVRLPIRSSALFTACLASCRPGAAFRDALGDVEGHVLQHVARHHLVDHAHLPGALGAHALAEEEEPWRCAGSARGWAKYSTPGMPMRTTGSWK
jgi:hypothetical protein